LQLKSHVHHSLDKGLETLLKVMAFRSTIPTILLFILLFASSASKPLQLDNAEFPQVAARTASTGLPLYYHGEVHSTPPGELRLVSGLYHPPLYIYSLAAWFRLFGFGETQVRMFGMVCALLQGVVVLEILRTLFGTAQSQRYRVWFAPIFLLNPYTLQTAAISDIDSTIYGPLLCGVLLVTLRISWRDGKWRQDPMMISAYLLLAGALTLCLWAKLTTILLVFPFLFLLLLNKLGIWRAVWATVTCSTAAAVAFLLSYWIYGKLSGLDIGYTFTFTWSSFMQRGTSAATGLSARMMDYRRNLSLTLPMMTAWTGVLPWIAALLAAVSAGRRAVRDHDLRAFHYCVLMCLGLLTIGYYCAKTPTFGYAPFKYTFVYWGLVLTAPVILACGGLRVNPLEASPVASVEADPLGQLRALFGLLLVCLLGLYVASRRVHDSFILNGLDQRVLWVVVVPGLVFLAGAMLPQFQFARIMLVSSLVFYGGFQLGVGIYQSRVDYSTTYDYGQTGFLDTVAFIRLNTNPNDKIAAMKDVGYKAERRYFETYSALYGSAASAQWLMHEIVEGNIKYVVFTEGRGQDQLMMNPTLQDWIATHCNVIASFGNYRIYQYAETTVRASAPLPLSSPVP
jgi:hypothetical protein